MSLAARPTKAELLTTADLIGILLSGKPFVRAEQCG